MAEGVPENDANFVHSSRAFAFVRRSACQTMVRMRRICSAEMSA